MTTSEAAPLYANFYRTLKRRAENGHQFTIAEIEDEVDRDPAAKRAFEQMAADVRAGRDVTLGEMAQKIRVPVEFAALLIDAYVGHFLLAMRSAPEQERPN
jgi:hypothetical protein